MRKYITLLVTLVLTVVCWGAEETLPSKTMQADFLTGIRYQGQLYTFEGTNFNLLFSSDNTGKLSRYVFPTHVVDSRNGARNRWHIAFDYVWNIGVQKYLVNQPPIFRLFRMPMIDLPNHRIELFNTQIEKANHDVKSVSENTENEASVNTSYFCPNIRDLEDKYFFAPPGTGAYYDFLPTSENSITLYVFTAGEWKPLPAPIIETWNYTGHWSATDKIYMGDWTKTGELMAPFAEPFLTTTVAGDVYFITLSGDVYLLNAEKKSLDKIWNNSEGPILACITDLDTDQTRIVGRDYSVLIQKVMKPTLFAGGDMAVVKALQKQIEQKK